MNILEELKIEIRADEIEEIVREHAQKIMKERGYELHRMQNNEGPFPDISFTGEKIV